MLGAPVVSSCVLPCCVPASTSLGPLGPLATTAVVDTPWVRESSAWVQPVDGSRGKFSDRPESVWIPTTPVTDDNAPAQPPVAVTSTAWKPLTVSFGT